MTSRRKGSWLEDQFVQNRHTIKETADEGTTISGAIFIVEIIFIQYSFLILLGVFYDSEFIWLGWLALKSALGIGRASCWLCLSGRWRHGLQVCVQSLTLSLWHISPLFSGYREVTSFGIPPLLTLQPPYCGLSTFKHEPN